MLQTSVSFHVIVQIIDLKRFGQVTVSSFVVLVLERVQQPSLHVEVGLQNLRDENCIRECASICERCS